MLRHLRRAAGSLPAHAVRILLEERAIKPKQPTLTVGLQLRKKFLPASRVPFCSGGNVCLTNLFAGSFGCGNDFVEALLTAQIIADCNT
jgi:hypothetical protein